MGGALEQGCRLLKGLVQALPLGAAGVLDHALDDEVAEAVVHHLLQRRVRVVRVADDREHKGGALSLEQGRVLADRGDLNGLLHNVAGALVLGELDDVALDDLDDLTLVLDATVLQHVLHHVVAVHVHSQPLDVGANAIQHTLELLRATVLQQALHHAATIHVASHLLGVRLDGGDDEGDRVGGHLLDALLDDVVAVHAFDARDDVLLQLLCNEHLRLPRHVLDGLLNDAATMCLVGEVNELGEECLHQVLALVDGTDVEKLLDDEVAEWVAAQVDELRE
mmetsp:Transcript_79794/g.215759  ORF Transcript_79794/g.215759 Transcript_79794/m.215759 type:complete len:280 (-) Transcript_79794:318-1157(-)